MAENTARGNVGRTRPHRYRLVLMDQSNELVVADSGSRSLWLANILDAGLRNHRLVIILVTLRFVANRNVGTGFLRGPECLPDREVAEFVHHRTKFVVIAILVCGSADEPGQRFKEPARQPDHLVRLRFRFIGLIWKLACVRLRTSRSPIKVNVVAWLAVIS